MTTNDHYPAAVELVGIKTVAAAFGQSRQWTNTQLKRGQVAVPPVGFKGKAAYWDHAAILRAVAIKEATRTTP